MTKFNNQTVIELYFNAPQSYSTIESHTGNLWVSADSKRLMNYSTCLVERHADYGLLVNRTSYSVTTSKIQNYIGSQLWKSYSSQFIAENVIQLDNVPQSSSSLVDAAKKHIEWAKGIKQVKVINYFDVWGNKKDGWEINNMCEEQLDTELLQLHESASSKDAFQLLKETGFFKRTARINQVDIQDLHDFGFEINQRKDGMPICRIEFIN